MCQGAPPLRAGLSRTQRRSRTPYAAWLLRAISHEWPLSRQPRVRHPRMLACLLSRSRQKQRRRRGNEAEKKGDTTRSIHRPSVTNARPPRLPLLAARGLRGLSLLSFPPLPLLFALLCSVPVPRSARPVNWINCSPTPPLHSLGLFTARRRPCQVFFFFFFFCHS